jgi:hypothetical protein
MYAATQISLSDESTQAVLSMGRRSTSQLSPSYQRQEPDDKYLDFSQNMLSSLPVADFDTQPRKTVRDLKQVIEPKRKRAERAERIEDRVKENRNRDLAKRRATNDSQLPDDDIKTAEPQIDEPQTPIPQENKEVPLPTPPRSPRSRPSNPPSRVLTPRPPASPLVDDTCPDSDVESDDDTKTDDAKTDGAKTDDDSNDKTDVKMSKDDKPVQHHATVESMTRLLQKGVVKDGRTRMIDDLHKKVASHVDRAEFDAIFRVFVSTINSEFTDSRDRLSSLLGPNFSMFSKNLMDGMYMRSQPTFQQLSILSTRLYNMIKGPLSEYSKKSKFMEEFNRVHTLVKGEVLKHEDHISIKDLESEMRYLSDFTRRVVMIDCEGNKISDKDHSEYDDIAATLNSHGILTHGWPDRIYEFKAKNVQELSSTIKNIISNDFNRLVQKKGCNDDLYTPITDFNEAKIIPSSLHLWLDDKKNKTPTNLHPKAVFSFFKRKMYDEHKLNRMISAESKKNPHKLSFKTAYQNSKVFNNDADKDHFINEVNDNILITHNVSLEWFKQNCHKFTSKNKTGFKLKNVGNSISPEKDKVRMIGFMSMKMARKARIDYSSFNNWKLANVGSKIVRVYKLTTEKACRYVALIEFFILPKKPTKQK